MSTSFSRLKNSFHTSVSPPMTRAASSSSAAAPPDEVLRLREHHALFPESLLSRLDYAPHRVR